MELNFEFCIKLFIYSFHNEGQREILEMIDTDLNPFMLNYCLCGCHYLHRAHQQLKSFEVKSFVYKICGLCHITATNLFPFCCK